MINSACRSFVNFFRRRAPQPARVTQQPRPAVASVGRSQPAEAAHSGRETPPAVDLSARDIRPGTPEPAPPTADLNARDIRPGTPEPAAPTVDLNATDIRPGTPEPAPVPGASEVIGLLKELGFGKIQELGLVLEAVSASFLHQIHESHAEQQVRALLSMTPFPLGMEDLARSLEANPLRAYEIANQVRFLAQCEGVDWVAAADDVICESLVPVLCPLAGEGEQLGLALGFCSEDYQDILLNLELGYKGEQLQQLIPRDARLRGEQGRPLLTAGQWLEVVAQAGADAATLEGMARHWQLPLPADCTAWHDFQAALLHKAATELVQQHPHHPDASVPLKQVWPLVCAYLTRPAFCLALDDTTDLRQFQPEEQHQAGLRCLMRYTRDQGPGLLQISWSCLQRLARFACVDPALEAQLPVERREPETVSRRLRPSDLLCLAEVQEPVQEALQVAALLGVGGLYSSLESASPQASATEHALAIWRRIYARVPWLDTGHLAQLFRQQGQGSLLEKLTRHPDSQMMPDVSLCQYSERAARFVALGDELEKQPEQVQAFVAQYGVDLRASYLAPAGTAEHWRLLNSLALDPLLLKDWQRFVERLRAASKPEPVRQPGTAAFGDDHLLNRTPGGYPWSFLCPITLAYIEDPVAVISRGGGINYFSKANLLAALRASDHPRHPLTRDELSVAEVEALELDREHLARIHQWRRQHSELEEDAVPFVPPGEAGLRQEASSSPPCDSGVAAGGAGQ